MCIIKCVSARRNLYSPVKFAAHLYVFLIYTETARMIERLFVHLLVRLDRNHPSLRFLRRFSFSLHHRFQQIHLYKEYDCNIETTARSSGARARFYAQLHLLTPLFGSVRTQALA